MCRCPPADAPAHDRHRGPGLEVVAVAVVRQRALRVDDAACPQGLVAQAPLRQHLLDGLPVGQFYLRERLPQRFAHRLAVGHEVRVDLRLLVREPGQHARLLTHHRLARPVAERPAGVADSSTHAETRGRGAAPAELHLENVAPERCTLRHGEVGQHRRARVRIDVENVAPERRVERGRLRTHQRTRLLVGHDTLDRYAGDVRHGRTSPRPAPRQSGRCQPGQAHRLPSRSDTDPPAASTARERCCRHPSAPAAP